MYLHSFMEIALAHSLIKVSPERKTGLRERFDWERIEEIAWKFILGIKFNDDSFIGKPSSKVPCPILFILSYFNNDDRSYSLLYLFINWKCEKLYLPFILVLTCLKLGLILWNRVLSYFQAIRVLKDDSKLVFIFKVGTSALDINLDLDFNSI
jgi:hypothetical protein